MKIKLSALALLILFINVMIAGGQDIPPTTSLVYPGTDGKAGLCCRQPWQQNP